MKKAPSRPLEGTWQWPHTDWSTSGHLRGVGGKDPERLNDLILKYQAPLKAYLLAAFPEAEDQAEELLQDFAQDRILRTGWLERAQRKRGRFRDLLKVSLKNFVRDRLRARRPSVVSMDELKTDPIAKESSSDAFALEWVRALLTEVLKRMEIDCLRRRGSQASRLQIWETFRLRLLQPILEDAEPVGYEELVARFGIASPSAAQNLLITAKRIFSRHLNEVIAEYEEEGEATRTELRDLRQFLSRLAHEKKE